jgi:hypothetical protein
LGPKVYRVRNIVSSTRGGEKEDGVLSSQVGHPLSIKQTNAEQGNVQVDPRHLSTPHDLSFPDVSPSTIAAYAQLNQSMSSGAGSMSPPLTLLQLSHPGLQSPSTITLSRAPWSPAVAPCSDRPVTGNSLLGWIVGRLVWPLKSRKMTGTREWLDVIEGFVVAAKGIEEAGWGGIQVHSAHGYLLAEYLSPLVSRTFQGSRELILCRRMWTPCLFQVYQAGLPYGCICST